MITVSTTENLAGVCIRGDYQDLSTLVDALHAITIDETSTKNLRHCDISCRLLALSYDLRHASMGDRKIELVANGLNQDIKEERSLRAPKKNVYYSCTILYPELFFDMLAMNELLAVRIRELTKSKHSSIKAFDHHFVWDAAVATVRHFQAEVAQCVKSVLTAASYSRWLTVMNGEFIGLEFIAEQYIDMLNVQYLFMTREQRLKNLSSIAKRLAEFRFDTDHAEIKEVIVAAAQEHKCPEREISLKSIQYPDEIVW